VHRRPVIAVAVALLPLLASCGDDGPDFETFCEAVDAGGGTSKEGYFGSPGPEHLDDLERVALAVPEEEERLRDAVATFQDFVRTYDGPTGADLNPASWPGEVRVAYDRLTNTASDECQ
jgi:hypothetical protein